jgi:hypothetical protein
MFTLPAIGQTNGTLSVSVKTSATGGSYAPKNIEAIWIEDSAGKFVKTLLAYASQRKGYLYTWIASTTAAGSVYNTVDATTGATQASHGTRTCTWNGTNWNRVAVPDGTYRLRMELTDKHSQGNLATVTFVKGKNVQNLSPANVPSFSSISVTWTPSASGIDDQEITVPEVVVFPNPGTGLFRVAGNDIREVRVSDMAGHLISSTANPGFDLTGFPPGIYLVKITTGAGSAFKKVLLGNSIER